MSAKATVESPQCTWDEIIAKKVVLIKILIGKKLHKVEGHPSLPRWAVSELSVSRGNLYQKSLYHFGIDAVCAILVPTAFFVNE